MNGPAKKSMTGLTTNIPPCPKPIPYYIMNYKQTVPCIRHRYNIRIGNTPYIVDEYTSMGEDILDYVIRDVKGTKIAEGTEEHIRVGKAFLDSTVC